MRYDNLKYGNANYSTPEYIDDRTTTDVERRTLKGQLNYTDLNRIENNCKEMADMLNRVGYFLAIKTRTDWTREDFPYRAEIDRIRNNVKAIMDAYQAVDSNPKIRFWERLNHLDVNALEQALKITDELVRQMSHQWRYAGQVVAGEEVSL